MQVVVQPIGTANPVRINLKELAQVRQLYMPAPAVRFAPAEELHRVTDEVAVEQPNLREELDFVKYEELGRRERLAGSPLVAMKGGQYGG